MGSGASRCWIREPLCDVGIADLPGDGVLAMASSSLWERWSWGGGGGELEEVFI